MRIADLDGLRLTPARDGSIEFPILFGYGATPVLMCIAAKPGATLPEIQRVMGRTARGPVTLILQRLVRRKLIVRRGRRYASGRPVEYIINPNLRTFRQFNAFLRRYASAFGLPLKSMCGLAPGDAAAKVPMPQDLCWTPTRTDILLLAALCGEVYPGEVLGFIRGPLCRIVTRFDDLMLEEVLRYRTASGALLHSLNPEYPAAVALRKLLQSIAEERLDVQAAAKFLRSRRRADASDEALHGKRRHIAQALLSPRDTGAVTRPRRGRRGSAASGQP